MQLSIESMAYGADAVGRLDGKAVFVSGGVPGDVVEAELVSEGKSFSRARVTAVVEPSPDRVNPPCPYAEVCGGCPWANLSYPAQLRAKLKNVRDALERIGGLSPQETATLVRDVQTAGKPWGYRNKIELGVVQTPNGISLGMHSRYDEGSVVPVDRCLLLAPPFQRLPKAISGALRYMGRGRDLGLLRCGIRASERTRQVEVALWTDTKAFPRNQVSKVLGDAAKASSVVRVLLKDDPAARKVAGIETLDGLGYWKERIAGETMRLSAPSFFQVNTAAAELLVDLVMEGLSPRREDVAADLYCGAGTFTLPLARTCEEVVAIESYGPAVRDLKRNLESNHLDEYVEAVGDDAERQLDALEDVDLVVVDPPRSGLDRSVVEALSSSPARSIAYVSCDPATLARDLAAFRELGTYEIESITPVDLFPQTYHVETVTVMHRKGRL